MMTDQNTTILLAIPACFFLLTWALVLLLAPGDAAGSIEQARKMVHANQTTCLKKGGAVQPSSKGDSWLCTEPDGLVSAISPLTQEEADAMLAKM